ncbi:unnamed protein product [Eruca vesicaria subsp. sativa]|uniref:RNase III domain-containing protein n=1 Tax=Eruca vesicaria subsp. sativa TaxID=29727 RepID=A0ABC8LBN7_ERUVS|nr:unnamed protein product [Eruca vesicaria subsp. sativa]
MGMMILSAASSTSLVRAAALDTKPKLRYNPNSPRRNPNSTSFVPPPPSSPAATVLARGSNVSDLLKEEIGDDEKWFPTPPKVDKPRSVFNAASLAYIGDSIYEIYARRHFLFPPLSIEEYNDRVQAVVRCEAQYALLQKLVDEDFLTKDEREILRWGKNVGSVKTRSTRRAGVAVYNKASSLETLIGYLYLANGKRLEEIMQKMGFSSGSSTEIMVKEAKQKLSALK